MKPTKIIIEYPNGSTWTTENAEEIRAIGISLPKGIHWKVSSDIETLRNLYFRMLTELSKHSKSGDSKIDLHNALKPMLFDKLGEFPQFFIDEKVVRSTKNLNYYGWLALIEQLKIEADNIFNYIFK